ncbi:hypothetical protein LTR84_010809 [Exophiala bonariae]|uniref:DJ-1/PfpI domain-containing protein n=1 Tax=Exophiala bonariae TaxID=1690606 RepID=A0AAV9NJV8_9EURO|nr:hypothetical protein LTR84_010809 [Exophiala bonariae]
MEQGPASTQSTRYNVLIPIYDQFNTLDVNAPFEILGNAALPTGESKIFNIFVTAEKTNTQSYEGATLVANLGFDEAISMVEAGNVDVLIVPGAGPEAIGEVLKTIGDPRGIFGVIDAFLRHGSKKHPSRPTPWLVSICTGALIIGSAGSFVGLTATTHWGGILNLQKICTAQGGPPTTIVRRRWVDAGLNQNGIHVLSSGGISCGMDAMLYFIKTVLGPQYAADIATMMDYVWNGGGFNGLSPSSALGQPMLESLGTGWTTSQS